jgi:hypothetical protein
MQFQKRGGLEEVRNLYRGAFNYRQSAVILYRRAASKRQAWLIMCRFMAKRDGVDPRVVMGLFDGSRDNYEITVEQEVTEIDDKDVA